MQKRLAILIYTLFAALVGIEANAAMSLGYYTGESKLAKGRWVKIRVANTGMQQITYEQLREWGFKDPSAVTVYGHGGVYTTNDVVNPTVPDDLAPQPTVDTGDRILFYGESNVRATIGYVWSFKEPTAVPVVQRNHIADAGYYFITDGLVKPVFETIPYSYGLVEDMVSGSESNGEEGEETETPEVDDPTVLNYHYSVNFFEEECTNPVNGGQLYFGRDQSKGERISLDYPLPDIYYNVATGENDRAARIGVRFIVMTSGQYPYMRVEYGNVSYQLDKLSQPDDHHWLSTNAEASSMSFKELFLPQGSSNFHFLIEPALGAVIDYGALDYMAFYYPRYNRLGSNSELVLNLNEVASGTRMRIDNVTDETLVWEVTDAGVVIPFETRYNAAKGSLEIMTDQSYTCTVPTGKAFRAIAFNPSATHNTVQYVSEVENQNIHGLEVPDLVILTSEMCSFQAERLAELHRKHLGHKVHVLRVEEIYNEFSSGTPALVGIRRMVKMFYERGNMNASGTKLRGLLLFGGGSYDNRAFYAHAQSLLDNGAMLPVFSVPDHATMAFKTRSYSADCYFGMCEDTFAPFDYTSAKQQVNVGRIPAIDETKAITAVDKIENHIKNLPTVDIAHRALILTDFGDANSHLANGEDVANTLLEYFPGVTPVKIYSALYPREKEGEYIRNAVARNFKQGVGFFSYSGHGRADSFSELKIWSNNAIENTDYSFAPVGMLATCDAFTFDHQPGAIGENFIFKNNGGLIAVIAACRAVYQNPNQALNNEVALAYSRADENTLTGDLYRIARNSIIEQGYNQQYRDNTMCYNFGGDPALPLYAASPRIVITDINNKGYNENGKQEIKQLSLNTLSGYVAMKDNPDEVDTSFNGTVILTLYESPRTLKTYVHTTSREKDTVLNINVDQDAITDVATVVTNGRFEVSFIPPLATRSGDSNRITLYAYSDDLNSFAQSYTTASFIDINNVSDINEDTEAPEITELYIDSPDFRSGDAVNGNFTVYALIAPDESGLKKSVKSVGGVTRVVIDDNRMMTIPGTSFHPNTDGSVKITLPVSSVSDGRHTLQLNVSDNAGNMNSRSIEFVAINTPASVNLFTQEITATHEATFDIEHSFAGAPGGRLYIEDMQGNTVFSTELPAEADAFPYVWDLRASNGKRVPDGPYNAYVVLNSGLQYAASSRAEVVVINR